MQYINDNLDVEGQITQKDGKKVLDTSSVINNNSTLQFNATTTIATIGDVDITTTVPSVVNSDENVKQTHLTTSTNRSILLATNNSTGTVTGQTYKNSGVTVNPSTKRITCSGYVVNGSNGDYLLTGSGSVVMKHTMRNHEHLFIQGLSTGDDFINNYYGRFVEGDDTIDTFIIAPFSGNGAFDFSIITYKIQSELKKTVSNKRFHIYLEYTQERLDIQGCLCDTNFLSGGGPHKLECYFDRELNVWFVIDSGSIYVTNGKYFNSDTFKKYIYQRLKQ